MPIPVAIGVGIAAKIAAKKLAKKAIKQKVKKSATSQDRLERVIKKEARERGMSRPAIRKIGELKKQEEVGIITAGERQRALIKMAEKAEKRLAKKR
jgi:hypothetical protein